MLIGVDFDNTIVCYDGVFHAVALEKGWVTQQVPTAKDAVRNHMRQQGKEEEWIGLQGLVYGSRILQATAFPGVVDFFRRCRAKGVKVSIISHKTLHPFRGEPVNLHHAALKWLQSQGFFDNADIALSPRDVFLELTKEAKVQRIASAGCTCFIDDLPEFLAEPGFPAQVRRLLYDPNGQHASEKRFERLNSWQDAGRILENGAVSA